MLIRNNVLFIWASVATSYTDRAPQVAENSEVDSPPPPCGELLCIHATSGGMDTFVGNIAISK